MKKRKKERNMKKVQTGGLIPGGGGDPDGECTSGDVPVSTVPHPAAGLEIVRVGELEKGGGGLQLLSFLPLPLPEFGVALWISPSKPAKLMLSNSVVVVSLS